MNKHSVPKTLLASFLSINLLALPAISKTTSNQCIKLFLDESNLIHPEISTYVKKNKFVTSRHLGEYYNILPKAFYDRVQKLTKNDHWIDLGAGKANAQLDYIQRHKDKTNSPKLTAIAYKLDRWFKPSNHKGRFEIIEGEFEKMNLNHLPKAKLISDVFGVFAYSKDLSTSLQKSIDLLAVGGELMIYFEQYKTPILFQNKYVPLTYWMGHIKGLSVSVEEGAIRIVKTEESVSVPKLEIINYQDDSPPWRQFVSE